MEGMDMNPDFWHGKRVFLTGHTGFKGSWLSLWLQQLGANLTGYALAPDADTNLFTMANVVEGMTSITGDVRDLTALQSAMSAGKPEIVIHMAAQALVRNSYADPVATYATNVMGSVHLFEAIRRTPGVRAVVNVTTDKCYENREWVWGYRENEPVGGHDPYSSSKACSELVSASFRSSFFPVDKYAQHGVAVATARAGNVIGGGDYAVDRLIPDIVAAFRAGTPVRIRNPHAVRPWQHVMEPLCGYLTLAEYLYEDGIAFAEAWNFGPEDVDCKPVSWIASEMVRLWGGNASWEVLERTFPHEAHYLKLDISKAKNSLGWQPHMNLGEALALSTSWEKQRVIGSDIKKITSCQIYEYQQKLN
jgi:CDP-glucose 4,6-dehydratase